jgi:hypothetical protein
MRGNISKAMLEKMKRKKSLKFKLGDSYAAPKFDYEDKKREKMDVTLFGRRKIIFLEMELFWRWITNRDLEWVWHVDIFGLLDVQLSPIWPSVKEFL